MSEQNTAVGVYDTHTSAEGAIKDLQKSGFKRSILGMTEPVGSGRIEAAGS